MVTKKKKVILRLNQFNSWWSVKTLHMVTKQKRKYEFATLLRKSMVIMMKVYLWGMIFSVVSPSVIVTLRLLMCAPLWVDGECADPGLPPAKANVASKYLSGSVRLTGHSSWAPVRGHTGRPVPAWCLTSVGTESKLSCSSMYWILVCPLLTRTLLIREWITSCCQRHVRT